MMQGLQKRLTGDHLRDAGETYFEHAGVALYLGRRLFVGALAAVVHGIIPQLFQTTASGVLRELGRYLSARKRRGS